MKKILLVFCIVVLLTSHVSASAFATIAMQGLSFASPQISSLVNGIVCVSNIALCAQQKIIGAVTGSVYQAVAEVSPEAAKALTTYNQVKGFLNQGAQIVEELQVNNEGTVEVGTIIFKDQGEIGNLIGQDLSADAITVSKDIQLDKKEGISTLTFTGDDNYVVVKDSRGNNRFFQNIQKSDSASGRNSFLKFDAKGELSEADFTVNERGGTYFFGKDHIAAPANSRVVYHKDSRRVELFVPDGSELRETPSFVSGGSGNANFVEIKGKNIQLPGKSILEGGTLTYVIGNPQIRRGTFATIDGFTIRADQKTDVDIFFSDSVDINKQNAAVAFGKTKFRLNGEGYDVQFNPKRFVQGVEEEMNNPYLKDLDFSRAKSGRFFRAGDRGEDVKKIQRLVFGEGSDQVDGIYGAKTELAVRNWQKANELEADGIFGKVSLTKALGQDTTRLITLRPEGGGISLSRTNGRLAFDFTGESSFDLGSKTFTTRFSTTENDYLRTLDFKNANNERSFQLNDKNENVKLIQRLVGAPETGTFDKRTKDAVVAWQKRNDLDADGIFGRASLTKALESEATFYKSLKGSISNNLEVPIDLTLRDSTGRAISRLVDVEGPGAIDTLKSYWNEGVGNRGYWTSEYKTGIHVNTVLFDNIPASGSLTKDLHIVSDTVVSDNYLREMQQYVTSESFKKATTDPEVRFNLITRKAGEITRYNPEVSLKLMSIFGSQYKDLSSNVEDGFGNRQTVNGKDSRVYKQFIPTIGDGAGKDPVADKRYRLLTVAGQYLYSPDGFLGGTRLALEHTNYEVLAYAGKLARQWKSGKGSKFGSGDFGDVRADFSAIAFAKDLRENPEATLKNFEFAKYFRLE